MSTWLEPLEKGRCRKWKLWWSRGSGDARRKKSRRFDGTKREAQAALKDFGEACDALPEVERMLPEYVREWASSRLGAGLIEENTNNQYAWAARVLDCVLDVPLAEVSDAGVRDALARIAAGDTPSGRPLSPKSVSSLVKCCRTACDEAVRAGLAPSNPFRGISVAPKSKPRRALDVDASSALLESLTCDTACSFAASMMLRTGLRAAEVLGAEWRDVSDCVSVRRDVTKTDAGERRVPLSEDDLDFVDERRQVLEKSLGRAGASLDGGSRLCCHRDGRPLTYNALRLWWARHRDSLGAEGMVLHELRHTYLTNLAQAGVHPSVMQRLAGHSSMAVTMEIYTHVQDSDLRSAVSALSNMRSERHSSVQSAPESAPPAE